MHIERLINDQLKLQKNMLMNQRKLIPFSVEELENGLVPKKIAV